MIVFQISPIQLFSLVLTHTHTNSKQSKLDAISLLLYSYANGNTLLRNRSLDDNNVNKCFHPLDHFEGQRIKRNIAEKNLLSIRTIATSALNQNTSNYPAAIISLPASERPHSGRNNFASSLNTHNSYECLHNIGGLIHRAVSFRFESEGASFCPQASASSSSQCAAIRALAYID